MSTEEETKPQETNTKTPETPSLLEEKAKQGRWEKIYSHPLVSLAGTIGTVVFGLLSLYLYYESKIYPFLTYAINPTKTQLVRTGQTSSIGVTFNNKQVTNDITAVQIALWNNGKQPIRKDAILDPVTICTKTGAPILEATLRNVSRKVVGLTLEQADIQKGRLGLSWNILEKDDGGSIQIIYEGNTNVNLLVDGSIVGQNRINDTPLLASRDRRTVFVTWLFAVYLVVCIVTYAALLPAALSKSRKAGWHKWYESGYNLCGGVSLLILLYLVGQSIYTYLTASKSPIPF